MMRCDAEWLGRTLAGSSVEELSPLLNLGASTKHFRQVEQPYIDELVFRPLEARGVRVIHSDLKAAEGVDLVGDVFDDADFARLKDARPRAVICTHMFEHVLDREELARRLLALLPEGGLFFVTVPSSYHEHHDPIDTMYRPTPDELAALFAGQQIVHKSELVGDTYWSHVARRPLTHLLSPLLPLLRAVPELEGLEALHAQALLAVPPLQGGRHRRPQGGVTRCSVALCLQPAPPQATSRPLRRHPRRGG